MKIFGNFSHEWKFDLPWHMVALRHWFYMVNVGSIEQVVFLHVRICGIRSLWEGRVIPKLQRSPTPREADSQALEALRQLKRDWTKISTVEALERMPEIFGLLEHA